MIYDNDDPMKEIRIFEYEAAVEEATELNVDISSCEYGDTKCVRNQIAIQTTNGLLEYIEKEQIKKNNTKRQNR